MHPFAKIPISLMHLTRHAASVEERGTLDPFFVPSAQSYNGFLYERTD